MGSKLFESIGLGGLDLGVILLILLVLVIVLIVLVVLQMTKYKRLEARYNKFMQGAKPKSMEQQIQEIIKLQRVIEGRTLDHANSIKELMMKFGSTFQKMGLVKYDAYQEMGGKLSYCLCILDDKNDGFLINSVHSTAGCYSYTKHIKKGKSTIELSPEELQSLKRAMVSTQIDPATLESAEPDDDFLD